MSIHRVFMMNASSVHKFVARIYDDNGDLISKGTIIINSGRDNDKPVGLIEDIWTDEKHRGKGLARSVITDLIEKAKEHKCYKIVLCCADHNIALYERFGFTIHQNAMRLSLS
jgi:ribosomal protein S18 acetylase RimI-like enzyme